MPATAASCFASAPSYFATGAWRRARGGPGGGGWVGGVGRGFAGRADRLVIVAGGSDGWGLSPSESGQLLRWLPLRLCLVRLAFPLSEGIAFRFSICLLKLLSSGGMSRLASLARLLLRPFAWPRLRLRARLLLSFSRAWRACAFLRCLFSRAAASLKVSWPSSDQKCGGELSPLISSQLLPLGPLGTLEESL